MRTVKSNFKFKGGVHPDYNKELARDKAIDTLPLPAELVVSMSQHLGAPAKCVVKVGDYVIKPEDGDRYAISKQASLIGVYNINKGYADFKQITILNQNEEYSIVKSNSEYGLAVYDYIALKGDSVTENDFVYDM